MKNLHKSLKKKICCLEQKHITNDKLSLSPSHRITIIFYLDVGSKIIIINRLRIGHTNLLHKHLTQLARISLYVRITHHLFSQKCYI